MSAPVKTAVSAFIGALVTGIAILVVCLVVISYLTLHQVREAQQTNTPIVRSTHLAAIESRQAAAAAKATNEQILDCITPKGKCFRQSAAATRSSIASVNQISIYAAACADLPGVQAVTDIQTCVIEKLAAHQPKPR